MMTSIQISEETKERLLVIMAKLQEQRREKITYEEAIAFLIEKATLSFDTRHRFVKKYHGFLDNKQAREDLKEARNLER
ncbi:MAG: hypothetical protein ACXACI_15100 [Candidatus Hodarchaeales archaeon]|jgi:hypothetical protein